KVFGELGQKIVGLGIEKILDVVRPKAEDAKNAVARAAESSDLRSFKTKLENAMLEEADLTMGQIMSLAMSILNNPTYGQECLQKLDRLYPSAKRMNPRMREDMAKKMIRDDINEQRDRWASNWFYYANDPVRQSPRSASRPNAALLSVPWSSATPSARRRAPARDAGPPTEDTAPSDSHISQLRCLNIAYLVPL